MGICASCLGRDRRSSPDPDESDPLLSDSQTLTYGSTPHDFGAAPPQDEADLQREREALARITAEAADNMIDIAHASAADLTQYHDAAAAAAAAADADPGRETDAADDADADADAAAWLQSVTGDADALEIKTLRPGRALVLDMAPLRLDAGGHGNGNGNGGDGNGGGGGTRKHTGKAVGPVMRVGA